MSLEFLSQSLSLSQTVAMVTPQVCEQIQAFSQEPRDIYPNRMLNKLPWNPAVLNSLGK